MKTTKRVKSVTDKFIFKQTPYEGKVAALYIRVSSNEFKKNEQGENERRQSVKTQIADSIEFANDKGWGCKVYDADCDVSGSEELADRPALQELVADIKAGKIHTVVARELSRLFRHEALQMWFKHNILRPHGVNVRLTSDQSFDLFSQTGKMVAAFRGIENENFLIELSAKIIRTRGNKAKEGTLRTSPAYGYGITETDGIRKSYIKEPEAVIIRDLFKRISEGEGVKSIINDFIRQGIHPKRGKYLHSSNILRWIRCSTYKGRLAYNGNDYASPYPPIVTPELWQTANNAINGRQDKFGVTGRKASNTHLLSGTLKCGYCYDNKVSGIQSDHLTLINMVSALNKTTVGGKDGKRVCYPVYRCQTSFRYNASACPDAKSFKASIIEGFIADHIRGLIVDNGKASIMEKRVKMISHQIEVKASEIEKVKEAYQRTLKMVGIGQLDGTDLLTIKESGNVKIVSIQKDIEALQIELSPLSGGTVSPDTMDSWDTMSLFDQKGIVEKMIDRILVYRDRIEIYPRMNPDLPTVAKIVYGPKHQTMLEIGPVTAKLLKVSLRTNLTEEAKYQVES